MTLFLSDNEAMAIKESERKAIDSYLSDNWAGFKSGSEIAELASKLEDEE